MRYRVHYLAANKRRTTQVEASSPQEAVIKFQHTRCDHHAPPDQPGRVLCVSPEPDIEQLSW